MKLTKPIGTRWFEETLEEIKLEQGLKTPQAVLYWLLIEYQKRKSEVYEAPTLERNMVFKKAGGGVVGEIDLTTSHSPGSYQTNALGQMEHIPYEDNSKGNSEAVKRLQKLKSK